MNAAAVRSLTFLLVATGVVASSVVILVGPAAAFTYAGRSPLAGAAAMSASGMALLSGFLVAVLEPRWLSSRLLAVAAALWVSPAWSGWQQFSPAMATVASAVALFTPAVMVHLAAGFASGSPTRGRLLLVSTYVLGGSAACIRAFAADPFMDVACWADCRTNPFAVIAMPWAEAGAMILAAGSGSIALCVILLDRLRGQSLRQGSMLTATVATGVLAAGYAVQAAGAALSHGDPMRPLPAASLTLLSAGLATLALAHAGAARSVAARGRRLRAVSASANPAMLDSLLATALRDPAARIVYRSGDIHVDATGRVVEPGGSAPGSRVTRIERGGEEVALILHSREAGDLEHEIGPALRVALENESLRVALDTTLADLRASCARIVAAADARRRILERDLHDGAQQELMVLAWRLQITAREFWESGDTASSGLLADAAEEARAALAEVRTVSHGLHPAILTSDGVEGAFRSFALTAPLVLGVVGSLPRLAPEAETALYSFGVAAVGELADAGAHRVALALDAADGLATVRVNAPSIASVVLDPIVADRLSALAGDLSSDGLRARVPIAAAAIGVSTDRTAASRA